MCRATHHRPSSAAGGHATSGEQASALAIELATMKPAAETQLELARRPPSVMIAGLLIGLLWAQEGRECAWDHPCYPKIGFARKPSRPFPCSSSTIARPIAIISAAAASIF
jgi:hypothetical protein